MTSLAKRLHRKMSPLVRPMASRAAFSLVELFDRVRGNRSPVPPRLLQFIGNGDFVRIGQEFRAHLISHVALKPSHVVVDVGCGLGRLAYALSDYIKPPGRYIGVDVVPQAIRWCNNRISAQHSHFSFVHSNVFNSYYNPTGSGLGQAYRLPMSEAVADTVVFVSVLTHLRKEELANYLAESRRILKPGGWLFATAFLLDETVRARLRAGQCHIQFDPSPSTHAYLNPEIPEHAVAYDSDHVRQLLASSGFAEPARVLPGSWATVGMTTSFQDIVLAQAQA